MVSVLSLGFAFAAFQLCFRQYGVSKAFDFHGIFIEKRQIATLNIICDTLCPNK